MTLHGLCWRAPFSTFAIHNRERNFANNQTYHFCVLLIVKTNILLGKAVVIGRDNHHSFICLCSSPILNAFHLIVTLSNLTRIANPTFSHHHQLKMKYKTHTHNPISSHCSNTSASTIICQPTEAHLFRLIPHTHRNPYTILSHLLVVLGHC